MHVFDEMKSWVGFTREDEERLRGLAPFVEPHLVDISTLFYERIQSHPGAAAVLKDQAQIERLKGTLMRWTHELLTGPWDEAYYTRRERIGRVHVEVNLPSRYMFTAMNVMRRSLCEITDEHFSATESVLICRSIAKITDIELAIMTSTYFARQEARQLASLQELLVSHMPVTVLLLDGDGRVTAATRPGTRLFGGSDITGQLYWEVLPPPLVDGAALQQQVARALETNREITIPRVDALVDGVVRNYHLSIVPLEHPQARVLVHVEDRTETVHIESRLRRNETLAQLGALSAAVAHELRNPLAGISGAIQVMARSMPESDRRKPVMEKVEQQVRRLNALVTDLLDFSRPTEAHVRSVELADLSRSTLELVRRDHPDVQFQVVGAGSGLADPNLLQQILLNLLINAAQAMDDRGEVLVEVSPFRIRISDSGPGIPDDLREKIFAPFFTTRARGTGLGLAICKKVATAMNAQLRLDEGPLRGACFRIDFPSAG